MNITQSLLSEIKREVVSTKKTLERIPNDKFDWRPHKKSNSLKKLATHLAQLAEMPGNIINTTEVNLADSPAAPSVNSAEDLIQIFDKGTQQTIAALKASKDEDLQKTWTLRYGDHIIIEAPKIEAMRIMGLSHVYHHRAQLGVYLRLLDIPVPATYGPSADEN